jgi:hypothetical protein
MKMLRAIALAAAVMLATACTAGEIILCGLAIPPSYPDTNAIFRLFSAVTDSNRVHRVLSVADSSKFQYTFEYGFITSAGLLLDLLVLDPASRRVTRQYCLTRDHFSVYGPQPPWGAPKEDDPLFLITNRTDMVAILKAVMDEFDEERPWPRMALPDHVDLSTATNREARTKHGLFLREDLEALRASITGRR